MKRDKFSIYLIILLTIIQAINIVSFIVKKEYTYLFDVLVTYFGYLTFTFLDKKYSLKTKDYIKLLLVLTFIIHSLLGHNLGLYDKTHWFDNALHTFGSFSFALLFYSIVVNTTQFTVKSKSFIFILILALGTASGSIFEIIEFILDTLLNTNKQKGLIDTNLDMIFNIIGSSLAGFVTILNQKC
ncbi:hypothetical protein [Thermohalobacter berrensis]|uniref:Uncharacterized protein n=1 Tax=Thermohalobacter berrensis TaxID=99594 RepID=A0A419SUW0_9FIRM|nr:hypothetical protein [Thermohalobacter berrensis]RKD29003.1 hypothetical protein BET03_06560 [Thermohalobacter berrensis]